MELEWMRKHFLGGGILDKDKMGVGLTGKALHIEPEEDMNRSPQHDVTSGQDS